MKAVAYMLDTEIWKDKIVGANDKVEYVVGGPSVELLFKAYSANSTDHVMNVECNGKVSYDYYNCDYVGVWRIPTRSMLG